MQYYNMSTYYSRDNAKTYTVMSAPLPRYFEMFYTILWNREIDTVVVLGKLTENNKNKIDQWWAEPSKGVTVELESFSVTSKEIFNSDTSYASGEDVFVIIEQYVLNKITRRSRSHKIFWYKGWPDQGTPNEWDFDHLHRQYTSSQPKNVLVHCSAGVGRTGTFITIDKVRDSPVQESVDSINTVINQLRSKRNYMVQTKEQYKFILDLFGLKHHNYETQFNSLKQAEVIKPPIDLAGTRYQDIYSLPPYEKVGDLRDELKNKTDEPKNLSGTRYPDICSLPPYAKVSKVTSNTHSNPTGVTPSSYHLPISRTPTQSVIPTTARRDVLWHMSTNQVLLDELIPLLSYTLCQSANNPNSHSLSEHRLKWLANWIGLGNTNDSELHAKYDFITKKWKDPYFKPFVLFQDDKPPTEEDTNLCRPETKFKYQNEQEAIGNDDYLYRLSGSIPGYITIYLKGRNLRERVHYSKLDTYIYQYFSVLNTSLYSSTAY